MKRTLNNTIVSSKYQPIRATKSNVTIRLAWLYWLRTRTQSNRDHLNDDMNILNQITIIIVSVSAAKISYNSESVTEFFREEIYSYDSHFNGTQTYCKPESIQSLFVLQGSLFTQHTPLLEQGYILIRFSRIRNVYSTDRFGRSNLKRCVVILSVIQTCLEASFESLNYIPVNKNIRSYNKTHFLEVF